MDIKRSIYIKSVTLNFSCFFQLLITSARAIQMEWTTQRENNIVVGGHQKRRQLGFQEYLN